MVASLVKDILLSWMFHDVPYLHYFGLPVWSSNYSHGTSISLSQSGVTACSRPMRTPQRSQTTLQCKIIARTGGKALANYLWWTCVCAQSSVKKGRTLEIPAASCTPQHPEQSMALLEFNSQVATQRKSRQSWPRCFSAPLSWLCSRSLAMSAPENR